jgi:toxin-antitoxin system PIN domain toxin
MISFFPDLNVWLALSDAGNFHYSKAWSWFNLLPTDARLLFSRYTQLGLLRLLTNRSVMGEQMLVLKDAWAVYDHWLEDSRVEFYPEPSGLDTALREATVPFAGKSAPKWIGDCYLLAYAKRSRATLVTFDRALHDLARKQHCTTVEPNPSARLA